MISLDAGRIRPAHTLFFPAAAIFAMLAVPLSVGSMQAADPMLPGLATATGHGHEMLFGYALAVLAGFLLTRVSGLQLYAMLGLWLAARLSYALAPAGLPATVLNVAFAAWVAAEVAPRFIGAAKKLRNQVFGPAVVVLAVVVALFHFALFWDAWQWRRAALHEAVVLFGLLMFFMGGRIIAPAAAGHLQQIGRHLEARVQPRLEGVALALLVAALLLLPLDAGRVPAAAALVAAGGLAGVRVARWRLWHCGRRPDLIGLGIGYAWLAAGLALIGVALLVEGWSFREALHALTVGALGTLTISVMSRTRMLRARQPPAAASGIPMALALVSAAAVARLTASLWGVDPATLHWVAALFWSLAYLLLVRLLVRVPGR